MIFPAANISIQKRIKYYKMQLGLFSICKTFLQNLIFGWNLKERWLFSSVHRQISGRNEASEKVFLFSHKLCFFDLWFMFCFNTFYIFCTSFKHFDFYGLTNPLLHQRNFNWNFQEFCTSCIFWGRKHLFKTCSLFDDERLEIATWYCWKFTWNN